MPDDRPETDDETSAGRSVPWRALRGLLYPYRGRLLGILALTGLATAAGLVEPLIYRAAINDVAGVFVGSAAGEDVGLPEDEAENAGTSSAAPPSAALPRTPGAGSAAGPPLSVTSTGHPASTASVSTSTASASAKLRPASPPKGHRRLHRRHHRATRSPAAAPSSAAPQLQLPHAEPVEPHTRGHVAPRTGEQMITTLLWAVGLLLVTNLAARLLESLADNLCTETGNEIERNFVSKTFRHVLSLPFSFFADRPNGALARQIDQSDQLAPVVSGLAREIAPELFLVVGITAIMFRESPHLALIALATIPAYLLLAIRSSRRLEAGLPEYYARWEEVSARIQEALSAVKTVKLSGAEGREATRLDGVSQAAYRAYVERNRLANRYTFWQSALAQLGKALVLAFGGWKVFEHQLTPGDVVMFVAYLDRLYDPIDSLTSLTKALQQHFVSLERAFRLLDTPGAEPGGNPFPDGPGRIEVRNVRFGYTPDRRVLDGVDFTLEPGTLTALVGPSGAGKTTIVDLLLRLREPDAGEILVDGQRLGSVAVSDVRHHIGVVAADGAVFRGTLADNIRYKRPEATDEEIRSAALDAGLGPTLERLPQGLETEIGEQGIGLSVGERQRLQLARAFVARPRTLVLDEATANLDFATEGEIRGVLERLRAGRTTLVIAHRWSMVEIADQVLVLEDGRITERGAPAELARSGGWLGRMARGAAHDLPPGS